jgi:hypothetical protein
MSHLWSIVKIRFDESKLSHEEMGCVMRLVRGTRYWSHYTAVFSSKLCDILVYVGLSVKTFYVA